jgi:Tol biopolymer transport system component
VRRLDWAALTLCLALATALMGVVGRGDAVGVGILTYGPEATGRLNGVVRIGFAEPMDTASVEAAFSISPAIAGQLEWGGNTLRFTPAGPWSVGERYTVQLDVAAKSAGGRQLARPLVWSFVVAAPSVIYLAPFSQSGDTVQNIWRAGPDQAPQQITFSRRGVTDFRANSEGTQIAYVEAGIRGAADLFLLDLTTGAVRQLTNCGAAEAACSAPSWSADGGRLVYERRELAASVPRDDRNRPSPWLLSYKDLATAPLLSNPIYLGGSPLWSPDGQAIAMFDSHLGAIVVYNLAGGAGKVIQTLEGETGGFAFSPSGRWLAYPQLTMLGGRFTSLLWLADLSSDPPTLVPLSGRDNPPVEDNQPHWRWDGQQVLFTRRSMDGIGAFNAQVYLYDVASGQISELLREDRYIHGGPQFSPDAKQIVMQRLDSTNPNAETEIWIYNVASGQAEMVVSGGFAPRWLP